MMKSWVCVKLGGPQNHGVLWSPKKERVKGYSEKRTRTRTHTHTHTHSYREIDRLDRLDRLERADRVQREDRLDVID